MIRISLPYIYNLAAQLEPLERLQVGTSYFDVFLDIFGAEDAVSSLYTASVFSHTLRSSRPYADKLVEALRSAIHHDDHSRQLDHSEVYSITNAFSQFKIALLAELEVVTNYFVVQKGGFDVVSLLDYSSSIFPPDLGVKVPEAMFDVAEAAKCLAFERATACGFHLFRATESVLRKYYVEVTEGKAEPKVRSIGVYLNALTQCGKGNPKVLAALKQMADLHRNPLIHPDAVLSIDEALSIHGIARSAIAAMLKELPDAPMTTATVAGQI